MYSKDELMEKDAAELAAIANDMEAHINANATKEENVYAILDKQAEVEGNKNPLTTTKRKRTRITKKDTDIVYSVNGKDGENFDLKKGKPTAVPATKAAATAPSTNAIDPTAAEPANAPKKRTTRRTKAATAEEAPATATTASDTPAETGAEPAAAPKKRTTRRTKVVQELDDAPMMAIPDEPLVVTDDPNDILETPIEIDASGWTPGNTDDAPDFIAEQLATQASAPKEEEEEATANSDANATAEGEAPAEEPESDDTALMATLKANVGMAQGTPLADTVWKGDPGDGTDFIPLEDLPVIDQGATPVADIFDTPMSQPVESVPQQDDKPDAELKYNFDGLITANGVLEVMPDGYGFLRSSDYNYLSSPDDVYVSNQQVKSNGLKTGDVVECHVRPPHDGEKYFPLTSIDKINGRAPSEVRDRIAFEHLTPLFPEEKFTLCGERSTTNLSTRIVDLFSPIGKGQRALIVAQPKTGKTMLMKNIANAIAANHPEAYLMMLLIDERPEEVTDMARTVNAEVIASTFDEPAERHVKIAGIVLEKAKRMVECGHDVVIFLDSITRLARAYNTVAPASGKVLTGGVDANALQKPKRFFGAARNIEGGGSLTIIATALIDTGSKMDEVIFEEFKGTGNMELQLDRSLSNKRKFPAINLVASSTRRDDLLHTEFVNDKMAVLRQNIADMTTLEAWTTVERCMNKSRDTEEFFMAMNS